MGFQIVHRHRDLLFLDAHFNCNSIYNYITAKICCIMNLISVKKVNELLRKNISDDYLSLQDEIRKLIKL